MEQAKRLREKLAATELALLATAKDQGLLREKHQDAMEEMGQLLLTVGNLQKEQDKQQAQLQGRRHLYPHGGQSGEGGCVQPHTSPDRANEGLRRLLRYLASPARGRARVN